VSEAVESLPVEDAKILSPQARSLLNLGVAVEGGVAPIPAPAVVLWPAGSWRAVALALKRALDIAGALFALIFLSPLFLACAILVKVSSPGPVLFAHPRVGWGGKPFRLWKFRTMYQDAAAHLARYLESNPQAREEWERCHKLKVDPRVTPVGRFLRRFSLDELPQFWNILLGEMSLVGPRPCVEREVNAYAQEFRTVLAMRPGLTGLWQTSGRSRIHFDERLRLEQTYVTRWNLWDDFAIMLKTVRVVLTGDGAY